MSQDAAAADRCRPVAAANGRHATRATPAATTTTTAANQNGAVMPNCRANPPSASAPSADSAVRDRTPVNQAVGDEAVGGQAVDRPTRRHA
ncbi:hypothetical protein ACIQMJ_19940 [Actinosynnema sp. NPDC091369]